MPIMRTAALGSSFAAGSTLQPIEDVAAMRSSANTAHLVAAALGAELIDLSVSGATTATILDEPQVTPTGVTFPPQIEGVPSDADLITITAGGNDLQYAGAMLFAAAQHVAPDSSFARMVAPLFPQGLTEPTEAAITAAAAGLRRVVEAARRRAPRARVLLVDYLTVFDVGVGADRVAVSETDLVVLRHLQSALESAHERAAELARAELVRASARSRGHGVGSADPWVSGFDLDLDPDRVLGSFHPAHAGMRRVADEILRVVA